MNVINKKGTEWWDKYARSYDFRKNPFNGNKARQAELQAIFDGFRISPKKNPRLVELGCGVGRFALNFAKRGYVITGIDISKISLDVLKKRARYYNFSDKIKTIHSDLYEPLKELNGSFDAGYIIVTYHCISNNEEVQKQVVRNFAKLIKQGGKLLIMEPNPLNSLYYLFYPFVYKDNWKEGFNIIHSRKGKLVKLLTDVGMDDIEVFYHSFLPTFFINYWSFVKKINSFLCSIPVVRNFSAFHIITAVKK